MSTSTTDEHYEEDFKFPLWELIKQRAEKKDISYVAAIEEVVPEYIKTIRYRDEVFENEVIKQRQNELAEIIKRKTAEKSMGE
jgi:hypothetical protein